MQESPGWGNPLGENHHENVSERIPIRPPQEAETAAERRVYEALASADRRGFVFYEWRRGYGYIELDFAVWIEGLGRFALQVKGGRYLLVDGEWYLQTREGIRPVRSCPLDETKLSTLDLHDDIKELAETVYNPFVIPVLMPFPTWRPIRPSSSWPGARECTWSGGPTI